MMSARVRECGSARVRECGSAGVRECESAGVVIPSEAKDLLFLGVNSARDLLS